jgi:hypothetical protein
MNHGARPWQKEVAILLITVRIQAGKYVPLVTLFPPWPFTRTSINQGVQLGLSDSCIEM